MATRQRVERTGDFGPLLGIFGLLFSNINNALACAFASSSPPRPPSSNGCTPSLVRMPDSYVEMGDDDNQIQKWRNINSPPIPSQGNCSLRHSLGSLGAHPQTGRLSSAATDFCATTNASSSLSPDLPTFVFVPSLFSPITETETM